MVTLKRVPTQALVMIEKGIREAEAEMNEREGICPSGPPVIDIKGLGEVSLDEITAELNHRAAHHVGVPFDQMPIKRIK